MVSCILLLIVVFRESLTVEPWLVWISLCSPGCLETRCIEQVALDHIELHLRLPSAVLGLKAYTTMLLGTFGFLL